MCSRDRALKRYGRKLIFVFCILFMSVTGIGQALSTNYTAFAIFAFLNAVGTSGVYPLAFILGRSYVLRNTSTTHSNCISGVAVMQASKWSDPESASSPASC